MKKFLIALAVALVLCVPAFADNEPYFAACPFSFTGSNGSTTYTYSLSQPPYYVYLVDSGNSYTAFMISETPTSGVRTGGANDMSFNVNVSFEDYYAGDGNSTSVISKTYNSDLGISAYTGYVSDAQIAADFADFLETVPDEPSGVSYNFNLPRGNVLYFQVSSESDVNITSYMETLSLIVNGQSATYGPWGDTGQRYGPAAALPTSGTTFPLLSQDPIHWNKDASQNMLGQTKIGRKTVHCITGQWYCFYNPNANHVEGGDPYQATVGATVNFKGSFSQVKVYPVSQKLSVVDGDLYSGSDDDFSSYYDGTLNENGTVSWTNQDGNIESPSAGGQNFQDGPQTADSLLEQIKITLSTVVSELQTLFTFGYEAIQSLVGLMRDFVSVFSGLYTWLPAPVYSALISAVIVAIVIGVFKVFL